MKKASTKAAKAKDQEFVPFAFSLFPGHAPSINIKTAGNFTQNYWQRRCSDADFDKARRAKKARMREDAETVGGGVKAGSLKMLLDEGSPAIASPSKVKDEIPENTVFIIHPGSRLLRIGRASDNIPLTAANVIARRVRGSKPNYSPKATPLDDTLGEKLESIRTEITNRMKHFKVRHSLNGSAQAITFNESVHPEIVAEFNDPLRIEWTDTTDSKDDFIVGEHALKIAKPEEEGFRLKWPISRGNFNTENYSSLAEILADIQDIITSILTVDFETSSDQFKDCSVVLIIPDTYESVYIKEMTNLFLRVMGFKQICLQQESLCVTFGAGLSAACVIDIGASKSSIACVDEGFVIPDSRITLATGGDDITDFLYQNLLRLKFPCKDIDLTRSYDWQLIESLKERMCTLQEADITFSTQNIEVRRPTQPLKKYTFKFFDESMIAPMALFAPHVIRFDLRPSPAALWAPKDSQEDAVELGTGQITTTMRSSVKQVFVAPSAPPPEDGDDDMDLDYADPNVKLSGKAVAPAYPDNFVELNAGKVPLDIAIVESLASTGSDERIKKFASSMIVVGGTARLTGISAALQSRVGGFIAQRFPGVPAGAVTLIPSPREIDPQILAWKGVSILVQLDVCADLWVRADDFDLLGWKALKDRIMLFSA